MKLFQQLQAYKVYEKHVNKAEHLEKLTNQKNILGVQGVSGAVERMSA